MKKLAPLLVAVLMLTGCTNAQLNGEQEQSPTPTASPRETPSSKPTPLETQVEHVISAEARAVLDANLGVGFAASPEIKDQYCTMSDTMLATAAEIAVENWRGFVEADFIAYIEETCGR